MFSRKLRASAKQSLVNIVLVSNAFIWYYFVIAFVSDLLGISTIDQFTTILVWTLHFAGIILSAIVGAVIVKRVRTRSRFLVFWMMLGIASSFSSIIIDLSYIPNVLIMSLLLGVSLGIGMPCCMGYFTENTEIEKRGRLAGVILLLSGVVMFLLRITSVENTGLQSIILTALRLSGLALFLILRPVQIQAEKQRTPSFRSLVSQRPFILYFVPWIMFSLITYLTTPIQSEILSKETIEFLIVSENVLIGAFAIVGGFLSDIVGRKRIAIVGFVLLGLGYSALGVYPGELTMYFYTIVDGVAWGMLFAIFVVTIWGDLSQDMPSDKHYAIGVSPFFIAKFLQLIIGSEIADVIPTSAIFSFTALFLFLAVLPLVYAPETLPEKTMKDRELKNYIEKARKEAGKAQKTEGENTPGENGDAEAENGGEDFAEKLKEAEKYY